MDAPLIIAAFKSEPEAAEAKRALIEQGIEAAYASHTNEIERLGPDIFKDGFDVFVNDDDAEKAIAILRRHWPEVIDVERVEQCPACASTDISRIQRLRLFVIAAAFLFIASVFFGQRELFLLATAIIGGVLLLAPNRRCRACGERWTATSAS